MAEYIIRPATEDDFQKIRSLIHVARINPLGLDWKRFIIAMTPEGELLGCGQIKLHSDGSREMATIAVKENSRGAGIAREIIETLISHEQNRPLYLMCRARLKLLYTKFGFHSVKLEEMPPYFKRISHLEWIFNYKTRSDYRLLVMCLD